MVKIGYKVLLAADVWTYTPRNLTNPVSASDLNNMLVGISGTATGRAAKLDEITSARLSELDPANMPADLDTLKARVQDKIPYTTKTLKSYTSGGPGVGISSSTSAWVWGSWTEVVPAGTITSDFIIAGVCVVIDSPTYYHDWCIQFGVGAAGAESSIIEVSGRFRYDSAAGRRIESQIFMLPIPIKVSANSRIAARAIDSYAAALAYKVKILYMELPL